MLGQSRLIDGPPLTGRDPPFNRWIAPFHSYAEKSPDRRLREGPLIQDGAKGKELDCRKEFLDIV